MGISAPIYKIDLEATTDFFGDVTIDTLPGKIVDEYNRVKNETVYKLVGSTVVDGSKFTVYRKVKTSPRDTAWMSFFKDKNINLADLKNQMQHLICFVEVGEELYSYTSGQSIVVFERFIEITFPLEVGRRMAKSEIKSAKSSQIAGTTLASDIHFRDPRRITHTESLESVWTSLSGEVLETVLSSKEITDIFGHKKRIRLDVGSSLKLGPKISTPEDILKLIKFYAAKLDEPLPDDDGWSHLDSIKILNPRRSKDVIEELRLSLAKKIFIDRDTSNFALMHSDAAAYGNATEYIVSQKNKTILSGGERPELEGVLEAADIDTNEVVSNLTSISIQTINEDYGTEYQTGGTILAHLNGELSHKGQTYYLLSGKWYEVNATYIESITKDFLHIVEDLDLQKEDIPLREWSESESEEIYNKTSSTGGTFINGDRILTDNIELFDGLISDGKKTYIVHVKKDFDVKVRDLRSQIINSAHMIENDLRNSNGSKLKKHYDKLRSKNKVGSLSSEEFLSLFDLPRVYVFAYGSETKVTQQNIAAGEFKSSVARIEVVSLINQFRQLSSTSAAEIKITWVKVS